jgi:tight adherence protein C
MVWMTTLISIAGVGMMVYGLWQLFRTPTASVKSSVVLKEFSRGGNAEADDAPFRERVIAPMVQELILSLSRLAPYQNIDRLNRLIALAGRPYRLTVAKLLGLKVLASIAIVVISIMYTDGQPFFARILIPIFGAILGFYLPEYWLVREKKKRQREITKALPDTLDLLTTCIDAGLGFDAALQKVAEKWNNPLAQEFKLASIEMGMGFSREEALRHIIDRTEVPEVTSFIAVLIQAYKLGVSISNVLHLQSEQLRLRRRQWAEEEAHKAPIKMLIPLALFIFPAIFVVILGPAIPRFFTQFPLH